MTRGDLKERFQVGKGELEKTVGKLYIDLAIRLDALLDSSREKTIAMERLEESKMWVDKHINLLREDIGGNDIY